MSKVSTADKKEDNMVLQMLLSQKKEEYMPSYSLLPEWVYRADS